MTMQADVKSAHRSTAGSYFAERTRLKGFIVTPAISTACTFEIRNGSASGDVLFTMDITSQTVANSTYVLVPGEGILASAGLYLTLSVGSLTSLSVFYG
tara:strand:- start:1156 stop:1452 length:297 start_codon:yes stop_codon:yes gene_type:complete